MVDKKEGAEMTCKNCGSELVCHMSEYKGDFKNKLQWQNEDKTAHYSTKDGKNFTCNVPNETEPNDKFLQQKQEEIKGQTKITQSTIQETKKTVFTVDDLVTIDKELDKLIVIEAIVTKKLTTDVPPNPQKEGMFMKLLYGKLEARN